MSNVDNMQWGIYGYVDSQHESGEPTIVYVGIDKAIRNHTRHKNHHYPAKKEDQVINKVLQTEEDKNRYHYVVFAMATNKENAYFIETCYVNNLRPVYNIKIQKESK